MFFVAFDDILEGRQVLREAGQHFRVGGPPYGANLAKTLFTYMRK